MELNDFQSRAARTDAGHPLEYYICKLTEEVGELNRIWARFIAQGEETPLSKEQYADIQDESGDILWCLSRFNAKLQLQMDKIAELVLKKNEGRKLSRFYFPCK